MKDVPVWRTLLFCFKHFYHEDHANAAMHMAVVKYSPITFELAGQLQHFMAPDKLPQEAINVLTHVGLYEPDPGR